MNCEEKKMMMEFPLDFFSEKYDQEQIKKLSSEQIVKSLNECYEGEYKAFIKMLEK